jgi:hypothetical protein
MIAYAKLEILKIKQKANHFQIKSRLYIQAVKAAFNELQKLKDEITSLKEAQIILELPLS